MAVDHNRPVVVPPERMVLLAGILFGVTRLDDLNLSEYRELYKIAMQEMQVEHTVNVAFFLQEAYDIYNARFR